MTASWWKRALATVVFVAITVALTVAVAVPVLEPLLNRLKVRVLEGAPPEAAAAPDGRFWIGVHAIGYGGFLAGAAVAVKLLLWMFDRTTDTSP